MRCKRCKEKFEVRWFNQKFCMEKPECIKAHTNVALEKEKKKERKPIPKRSEKRTQEESIYSKLSNQFKDDNPLCKICNKNKTTDVHHKNGRNGKRLNNTNYWMALCRLCHGKVHLNPKQSREKGWLI